MGILLTFVRMRARRVFIAFFTPGWLYSSVRTPFSSSRSMVENNSGWSSAGSPSSSVWRLSSSSSLDLGNEVCNSQGHRLCLSDSDVPVGDGVTLLGFLRGILAFLPLHPPCYCPADVHLFSESLGESGISGSNICLNLRSVDECRGGGSSVG